MSTCIALRQDRVPRRSMSVASVGPDLDILAELRDSAGNSSLKQSADSLSAHLGQTLASGLLPDRACTGRKPARRGRVLRTSASIAVHGERTVAGRPAASQSSARRRHVHRVGRRRHDLRDSRGDDPLHDGRHNAHLGVAHLRGVPLHLTSTRACRPSLSSPAGRQCPAAETYTIVPARSRSGSGEHQRDHHAPGSRPSATAPPRRSPSRR